MHYDIEEFYPSISEDLLEKAINYAEAFVDISSDEEETIVQCRKSLLFNNSDIWIKKRATRTLTAQKFASSLVFIFYIY